MLTWLKEKLEPKPKVVVVGIVNQEILDTLENFNREWDQAQEDQVLEFWEVMEKAKEEISLLAAKHKRVMDAYELRHKALWSQIREMYSLPLPQDCQGYKIDAETKQIGYVR